MSAPAPVAAPPPVEAVQPLVPARVVPAPDRAPAPAPVAVGERQGPVDLLRGLALLGILLVNMEYHAATVSQGWAGPEFGGALDRAVRWAVLAFAQGKFYLLFSLLFGYGLAVQLARAEASGTADRTFLRRYGRRLVGLFALGLAHGLLLFVGDILVPYALLGAVLLLFRRAPTRRLLGWAAGLLVAHVFLLAGVAAALSPEDLAVSPAREAEIRAVYAAGPFPETVRQRARDLGEVALVLSVVQWPSALAMFLLGLAFGRRGLLARPEDHRGLFRRLRRWGLPLGLAGGVVGASLALAGGNELNRASVAALLLETATAPALTLGYLGALVLALGRPGWRRRLAPLESPGRMSLTNYLAQSLVCAAIFQGWGLGLFGEVGPAAGVALAVAVWAAQVPLSGWWLRRFRFGPAEWLLRSFTYGRWQPLRGPGGGPSRG